MKKQKKITFSIIPSNIIFIFFMSQKNKNQQAFIILCVKDSSSESTDTISISQFRWYLVIHFIDILFHQVS